MKMNLNDWTIKVSIEHIRHGFDVLSFLRESNRLTFYITICNIVIEIYNPKAIQKEVEQFETILKEGYKEYNG